LTSHFLRSSSFLYIILDNVKDIREGVPMFTISETLQARFDTKMRENDVPEKLHAHYRGRYQA